MGTLQQQSILKGRHINMTGEEIFVHKIFQSVANKFPKRAAIIYEDITGKKVTLRYEELEVLSNKLARIIENRTYADRQKIVAVLLPPSHLLVAVLTAILKAGMAYLPLNHEFPRSRVEHILKEAQPTLVIAANDTDASMCDGHPFITLERLLDMTVYEPADACEFPVNSEGLSIVLYTSGSTGTPKGVKLPHATVMNRLKWQWREFPFGSSEERCIFKTALTFVDSAPEIWGTLLQGRTLVVVEPKHTKDPKMFIQILEKNKIQRLVLVPSLLQSLLMYLNLQKKSNVLSNLRLWICSGETLSVKLAENFFNRLNGGDKILANFYGSTEVMGDVTFHLLSSLQQLQGLEKVPIGKPIDNSIIYLVNEDMNVVPQGEIGEIIVAGKNLAAGYIQDRDSNKFLDNPHGTDPDFPRVFRTGDYARIVKGIVIYEGRRDSQIKIRGHRVDLTEVEKSVNTVADVQKAVVLCYKPGEDSQAMIAFVVADKNITSGLQIEKILRNILPPYMVPQVFIIDFIPLLTNGKTDRQALLKQYEASIQSGNLDPVKYDYFGISEEQLPKAEILFSTVASVIGHGIRGVIQLNSNFYELGGNSLNSIYTVTKLRDQGYHISITDFITAKNMFEILTKMKVNCDSGDLEDTLGSDEQYVIEPLNDSHKEDVIEMITESFYSKADLERWLIPDIKRNDYHELVTLMWEPLVEKNLSFVIKSVENAKILGVAFNFDARDEPEVNVTSKLTVIFDFLEFLEGPIRETKLPKGVGQIFHSFMMSTNQELTPSENVIIMKELEYHCLEVAKRKGFAGIFTTNTSPLTQQLGTDIYNYEVMLDYQVNKYVAPDGLRPFGKAPDDQRAVCSWKPIVRN